MPGTVDCDTINGSYPRISCQSNVFVTPGTYQAEAGYTGFNGEDQNGNTCTVPGSSDSVNITVPKSTNTFSVQGPTGPLQAGQILSIPISLTPSELAGGFYPPYPTGNVTLYYGSQALASQPVSPDYSSPMTSLATISESTKGIPPGKYSVQVAYVGDANYVSTTTPLTITIEAAQQSTSTVLSISPNPLVVGETANLDVTVTPTGNVAPTGTVEFLVGSTKVASATVNNGMASLAAPTTGYAPGTYNVIALYSGDSFNLPSTSSPVSVTIVAKTPTATAVAVNPASLVEGQSTQITATVVQQIGDTTPTGTVTLTANGAPVTTLPLKSGSASISVSTAGITPGNYNVVAAYSGSATAQPSTSDGQTVTILKPASVTLTAAPNPVTQGNVTTLIATVVDGNGTPVTSGTVNFSYAGNALGSAALGAGGTAQLPIDTGGFAVGTYVIQATYTGSTTIPPASGTVSLAVQ